MFALPADLGLYGREPESIWTVLKTFDIKGSILLTTAIIFLILGLVSLIVPFSTPRHVLTGYDRVLEATYYLVS